MDTKTERKARNLVNRELHGIGNYHPFIPVETIDTILVKHGFHAMEEAIYCGREGRCSELIGDYSYISLTWYKMESGKYEIVSYVS